MIEASRRPLLLQSMVLSRSLRPPKRIEMSKLYAN